MIKLNKGTLFGLVVGIVVAILVNIVGGGSPSLAGYRVGSYAGYGLIGGTVVWWMIEKINQ